ncbi:hypothetical protein [Desulfonauticus submarinus]
MKKYQIKQAEVKNNKLQLAFLEGVIMPNGEFVSNGKSMFLKEDDKLYLLEK